MTSSTLASSSGNRHGAPLKRSSSQIQPKPIASIHAGKKWGSESECMIQRPSAHCTSIPVRVTSRGSRWWASGLIASGHDLGRRRPVGRQLLALAEQPADLRVLPAGDRQQHARVDALPSTGEVSCPQRRERALRGEHPGEVGAVRARAVDRPLAVTFPPGLVAQDPGLGHHQGVVGEHRRLWSRAAEPRDRAADQARVRGLERRVVEPEPLGFADGPVVDHDVDTR